VNRLTRCLFAVGLLFSLGGFAACGAARAGDTCSETCPASESCETICECGNAGCPTYACVTISSTGGYTFPDGGQAMSCSQL
jgi:hypothetical protein